MSEAVKQLQPVLKSLNAEDRIAVMDYLSRLEDSQLKTMLDQRRDELDSGIVKGIPADEYFAHRNAQRS